MELKRPDKIPHALTEMEETQRIPYIDGQRDQGNGHNQQGQAGMKFLNKGRPEQIELFLDSKRPRVQKRHRFRDGIEIACVCEEKEVGDAAEGIKP